MLLILATIAYFGVTAGQHWWRNYEFQYSMQNEAAFAHRRADSTIRRRLRERADTLDLPDAAKVIRIKRSRNAVVISSEYFVNVEFPLFVREVRFAPAASFIR